MNSPATLATLRAALDLVGTRLRVVAPYTFAGKANASRAVVTLAASCSASSTASPSEVRSSAGNSPNSSARSGSYGSSHRGGSFK